MRVTVFKNATDSKSPYYTRPEILYQYIKNGRYKDKVELIRNQPDRKKRNELKKNLPGICWSGEFSQRGNDFCIKHSGLVCVDFDHIENLDEFKQRIFNDKYTYIAFVSPSGDGLKVIIKIPASKNTHSESCAAITNYFQDEKLDEFRDISRLCFISYDPDIYINVNSDVFNKLESKKTAQIFYPNEIVSDHKTIFENLVKWLDNKFEYYSDGNKHKYLVKLSSACMRFGIPQITCLSFIIYEFQNKASYVPQKDIEKIVVAVYKNYSKVSCTAHFERTGKPIYTVTKKEVKEEIFEIEFNEKDIIYLENITDSMMEGFRTGKAKGTTTCIKSFDKHWTWRKKEVTFIGGIGNIGKTTMVNNLCVLKAIYADWRFGVFSPEQDPPDDFYNDLIHTYKGLSTEPYHENQMSESQYKESWKFIGEHFYYIYPENESPTPDYINNCFEQLIKKHKIDVCIIDPFNQLDNDWRKYNRDDLYISEFLTKCKRFAQVNDIAYLILGHPKNSLQRIGGNYESPNMYDYAGGAMWGNKCDNILCYHRPYAITDPSNTTCHFISQKIKKRKLTGIPGMVEMNFDIKTNRFIELNGYDPFTGIVVTDINPDSYFEPIKCEDEPPF